MLQKLPEFEVSKARQSRKEACQFKGPSDFQASRILNNWTSLYQILGPSDHRTLRTSDYRVFELSDLLDIGICTIGISATYQGPSDLRISDPRNIRSSKYRTFRPLDFIQPNSRDNGPRIIGTSDYLTDHIIFACYCFYRPFRRCLYIFRSYKSLSVLKIVQNRRSKFCNNFIFDTDQ